MRNVVTGSNGLVTPSSLTQVRSIARIQAESIVLRPNSDQESIIVRGLLVRVDHMKLVFPGQDRLDGALYFRTGSGLANFDFQDFRTFLNACLSRVYMPSECEQTHSIT